MKNNWPMIPLLLVLSTTGCASAGSSQPFSSPARPDTGVGEQVVARIASLEARSYTDHLVDGSLLVSDVFVIAVLEPQDLAGIVVHAYYRGKSELDGHIFSVGDVVGFHLPSEAQRSGILLWDLQGLKLLHASPRPQKPYGL